ncbi:MAG: NUDIX domain-containing protein [Chloroflexi bacterium]|nr:NUDIX domain-containing protein [Chloroflexota bacterium]
MTTSSVESAEAAQEAARRPDVAVLVVIFTVVDGALQVLLIERSAPPAEGEWAIPGGALLHGESLEQAAVRKLAEETGVTDVFLEQLYTFGDLDASPSDGSVGVAWFALVDPARVRLAQRTAWRPGWWSLDSVPQLAFDNERVLEVARERLINKLQYTDAAYSLLPPTFTMRELQQVYEAILGRPLDKRNFRRRLLATDFIAATAEMRSEGRHRPARLYQFVGRS